MRIDKYLADMGAGTRGELRKSIRKNGVRIGGELIFDPGYLLKEDGASDVFPEVIYQGELWQYEPVVWYMLNKPAGVLSASEDRRQTTVVDLIRDAVSTDASAANASAADHHAAGGHDTTTAVESAADGHDDGSIARSTEDELVRKDLFPVGRLDKDTEGLLIITNDGLLAHQLLVPKHHIDKTYYAIVTGTITEDDQRAFTRGIRYDEKLTALPATLRVLSTGKTVAALRRALGFTATSERLLRTRLAGPAFIGAEEPADITDDTLVSEVEITIQEGKFHQIKKMVKALPGGKEILYLRRITMGALRLDPALAPGEFRKLSESEVRILKDETN